MYADGGDADADTDAADANDDDSCCTHTHTHMRTQPYAAAAVAAAIGGRATTLQTFGTMLLCMGAIWSDIARTAFISMRALAGVLAYVWDAMRLWWPRSSCVPPAIRNYYWYLGW